MVGLEVAENLCSCYWPLHGAHIFSMAVTKCLLFGYVGDSLPGLTYMKSPFYVIDC
jgi:hypothetical protein